MALIELRCPGKITEREKETGKDADSDDPNAFDERMPKPPDIELLKSVGIVPGQVSEDRFL